MLQAIGADVEEFVVKGGEVLSAIGLCGGDKHSPVWVNYGNIQEDNVLAEYAINPCSTEESFVEHIQGLRAELLSRLPGYSLATYATHVYERDKLIGFGNKALEFGCSAEFNAWEERLFKFSEQNLFTQGVADVDIEDRYRVMAPSPYTELRTAGGHVHFSYDGCTDSNTLKIIRVMDYLLGCWSVFSDADRSRRELYGKAGYCRIKTYGGEYRTLSNFWISSEETIRKVFHLTELAVNSVESLDLLQAAVATGATVQQVINNYDVSRAVRIYNDAYALLTK